MPRWTDAEDAVIRRHYPRDGVMETARRLPGRSVPAIQHRAGRLGVFVTRRKPAPPREHKPRPAMPINHDDLVLQFGRLTARGGR